VLAVLLVSALACGRGGQNGNGTADADARAASTPSAHETASAPPGAGVRVDSPAPAPARSPSSPPPPPFDPDGGGSACRLLSAPYVDPSFIAPVALRLVDRGAGPTAELVFNEAGAPRVVKVGADPVDAASVAAIAERTRSTLPACAVAGEVLFCPDSNGDIHAWRGAKHDVVAHSRTGTEVSAAAVGDHVALGYLAERVTSEGLVREAWVRLDDAPPVRLSEEGSGATFVALGPRGDGLLAMTIDARTAMTPAHARPITLDAGKWKLGVDAVVFVGGSAERHNAGALATSHDGSAFELVAVADGAESFGMASIRVEAPPREDEPVVWSLYPNGLDPAPLAATRGEGRMVVARVRPLAREPGSMRLLEVGDLSREGVFAPTCIVDEARFIKDVEVELDTRSGKESLWVFYRDPRGSVLEHRALPPGR
jgi:hypothetical protein